MSLDADFLEREYNPRVQIPAFAGYFARWKADAQAARSALPGRLNIAYGPAAAETMDFFPAPGPHSPLLMFMHGGYWRALDKADFSWLAPAYVAAGISVAIPNYGLAPTTPVREIAQQMRRAWAWIHANADELGVSRRRLFCSGHSAGGHLTAMMLATDWPDVATGLPRRLLAGAISVSGVFDLVPLTHAEFLRKDLALDEAGARALSPCRMALQDAAPLLRALGELESGEFHRQSALIAGHWPGICAQPLLEVPDRDHLSVCDALSTPGNVLFGSVCDMVRQLST